MAELTNEPPAPTPPARETGDGFDKRGADRLAREVATLVRRGVISERSPAADALLDYAPELCDGRTPRVPDVLAECERAIADLPQWRQDAMVAWLRAYGDLQYRRGLHDATARPDSSREVRPPLPALAPAAPPPEGEATHQGDAHLTVCRHGVRIDCGPCSSCATSNDRSVGAAAPCPECARLRAALLAAERLLAFHHEPGLRNARAGDPCPICDERGALSPETAAFAKARRAMLGLTTPEGDDGR